MAARPQPQEVPEGKLNLVARTKHLLKMGHSKEEIADILKISRAEMDFLESLSRQ